MPPLWFWPLIIFLLWFIWALFDEKRWHWLMRRLGFSTWERISFDFTYYNSLRDSGLSHKETIRELDRLWEQNHS